MCLLNNWAYDSSRYQRRWRTWENSWSTVTRIYSPEYGSIWAPSDDAWVSVLQFADATPTSRKPCPPHMSLAIGRCERGRSSREVTTGESSLLSLSASPSLSSHKSASHSHYLHLSRSRQGGGASGCIFVEGTGRGGPAPVTWFQEETPGTRST